MNEEIMGLPTDWRSRIANVLMGGFTVMPGLGVGFINVGAGISVFGVCCGIVAYILGAND